MYKILRFFGHQDWVPYGIRYRIIKLFVPFNKNKNFVVGFFNLKYEGNLNSYIDWLIFFFGAYEKELLTNLKIELLKSNRTNTVLDIGANVGNHTLFFSQFFKTVHSFEPYNPIFEKLKNNIQINNLNNVFLHKIALSNQNMLLPFIPPLTTNEGTGTLNLQRAQNKAKDEIIQIEAFKGDTFCKNNKIDDIDFIKIDVEGHELEVLDGLRGVIQKNRPIVLFEYTPMKNKEEKYFIFNNILPDYKFFLIKYGIKKISFEEIKKISEEVNLLAIPI